MSRSLPRSLAILFALLLLPPALQAQGLEDVVQLSDTTRAVTTQEDTSAFFPSLAADGQTVAFSSDADLTGDNPDGTYEIFLWRSGELRQITDVRPDEVSDAPLLTPLPIISADGRSVAILWSADLTGENPALSPATFLWREEPDAPEPEILQVSPTSPRVVSTIALSADGRTVAFDSTADPVGQNPQHERVIFLWRDGAFTQVAALPDGPPGGLSLSSGGQVLVFDKTAPTSAGGNRQIFRWSGGEPQQITIPTEAPGIPSRSFEPQVSHDGGTIAFLSFADWTGMNPDHSVELFSWRGGTFTQVTDTADPAGGSFVRIEDFSLAGNGRSLAFTTPRDATGENPDRTEELFYWSGGGLSQLTDLTGPAQAVQVRVPSLGPDGLRVAFASTADLVGENADGSFEVFLAGVAPPPPAGPWLSRAALPGFEAKVRILPPEGGTIAGDLAPDCIPETVCVSGALPERPEVFIKVIGPRPNGFLWAQITRFTPSGLEIWLRQVATGEINYYRLEAVGPGDELPGLQDRRAFLP